jgi:membrane associated rhomboid family serine protease
MTTAKSVLFWAVALFLVIPLPLGTNRKNHSRAWATYSLIAVNIVAFIALQYVPPSWFVGDDKFVQWGLIPDDPRFVTLFTSMFMHVNSSHLLWNMLFLWMFAPCVEDAIGSWALLILYIGGGVAAGLLHTAIVLLFAANAKVASDPLVGASGAISTVLGLYTVRFYQSRLRFCWLAGSFLQRAWYVLELPAIAVLMVWLAQSLVGGALAMFHPNRSGVAYWAHVGGFVFGMVAAELTNMLGEGRREYLRNEANAAQASGNSQGMLDAARKYALVLEENPRDRETRAALAGLIRHFSDKDPGALGELSEQSSNLLAGAIDAGEMDRAVALYLELQTLGIRPNVAPELLLLLAQWLVEQKEATIAAGIYRTLLQAHPDSEEARIGHLELAALDLGELDDPEDATNLMRSYAQRYGPSTTPPAL